jgi:hypothetical protein
MVDIEIECRARLAQFATVLGQDANSTSHQNIKKLIKEINKYGNRLNRAIIRRGNHKASGSGKGGIDLHPDRE